MKDNAFNFKRASARLISIFGLVFLAGAPSAIATVPPSPAQFKLTVISSDLDDSRIPVVNGDNVVWVGLLGTDHEVYRYNISTGVRSVLPDVSPDPGSPAIDGNYVAWDDPGKINLNNLSTGVTTVISNDPYTFPPKISGNHVVWLEAREQDSNLRLMDYNIATQTTQQLVGYIATIRDLSISGNDVVWDQGVNRNGLEIFHYNLATGVKDVLTSNVVPDDFPRVSDGNVVWQTYDSESNAEVFRRNLATGVTEQLTLNSVPDRSAEISGTNVVWQESAATTNVFYRNLSTGVTTQLTHATAYPESAGGPLVSGSNVMWFGDVGPSSLDREVYYYDLKTNLETRLTDNNFFEQYGGISGQNIVFLRDRSLQTNRWDVVVATPIPEPGSLLLLSVASLVTLNRRERKSIK